MAEASGCLDKEDAEENDENVSLERSNVSEMELNKECEEEERGNVSTAVKTAALRQLIAIVSLTEGGRIVADDGSESVQAHNVSKCHRFCRAWNELISLRIDFERYEEYVRVMFRNTLHYTMSWEWDLLPLDSRKRLQMALSDSPILLCQTLSRLLPDPWGQFSIRAMFCCDPQNGSIDTNYPLPLDHCCTSACYSEPRHVTRSRVELLCAASCDEEALQLCLMCNLCPILKGDYFYMETAFRILYCTGNITRMTRNMSKLSCHDGFRLIQHIVCNEGPLSYPLVECLIQILLVRDLVGPSSYCCTLSLMNLWCSLHVRQHTSLEDVSHEAHKLGALASTSAHLYLFVDVLYKKYGRKLLALYLHLYVHALTLDLNNLEYSRLLNCSVAVTEMETHLASMYTKLGHLLDTDGDSRLLRECVLTAFSLEPTIDRLTRIRMWASLHHFVGPPRLIPCSGECHCSEKGLCRKQLPTWYNTRLPHEILDSDLEGVTRELRQDLSIVVEGPRCKWLTWSQPWHVLNELCDRYLETSKDLNACGSALGLGIDARLKRMPTLEPQTADGDVVPTASTKEKSSADETVAAAEVENDDKKTIETAEQKIYEQEERDRADLRESDSPGVCPTAALLTSQMSQAMEFVSLYPRSPSLVNEVSFRETPSRNANDVLNSLQTVAGEVNCVAVPTCGEESESVTIECAAVTRMRLADHIMPNDVQAGFSEVPTALPPNPLPPQAITNPFSIANSSKQCNELISKEPCAAMAESECLLLQEQEESSPQVAVVEHTDSSITLQSLLDSISMMPMDSPPPPPPTLQAGLTELESATCEGIELLATSALLLTDSTSYSITDVTTSNTTASVVIGSDSLVTTSSTESEPCNSTLQLDTCPSVSQEDSGYEGMATKSKLQEGLRMFSSDAELLDPLLSSVARSVSADDSLELTAELDRTTVMLQPLDGIGPPCTAADDGKRYLTSVMRVSDIGDHRYDITDENKCCELLADHFQAVAEPLQPSYTVLNAVKRNEVGSVLSRDDMQKKPTSLSELVQSVIFCDAPPSSSADCSSGGDAYGSNNNNGGTAVICDGTGSYLTTGYLTMDGYGNSTVAQLEAAANMEQLPSSASLFLPPNTTASSLLFGSPLAVSLPETLDGSMTRGISDLIEQYVTVPTSESTGYATSASSCMQSRDFTTPFVVPMMSSLEIERQPELLSSLFESCEMNNAPLYVTMDAEDASLGPQQSYILTISPPSSTAETAQSNSQMYQSAVRPMPTASNVVAPLSVASVTLPSQIGNNNNGVVSQNGTVSTPGTYVSRIQIRQAPTVGLTHYQIEPLTSGIKVRHPLSSSHHPNVRQLAVLPGGYQPIDTTNVIEATGQNSAVKYIVQTVKPNATTQTQHFSTAAATGNRSNVQSNSSTVTAIVASSQARCDILAEATAKALGHQQHHMVAVEDMANVLVSSEMVPPIATISTATKSRKARRRPGSLFTHRKERAATKWMSIINPHGKLGYRKVGVEQSTNTKDVTTATVGSSSVSSSVAQKLPPSLPSLFTTVTTSTSLVAESTKHFATPAILSRNCLTFGTSATTTKHGVPIVKKCYSPALFATNTSLANNNSAAVPKVFTVTAPSLSQLKNIPRKVTTSAAAKNKQTVCPSLSASTLRQATDSLLLQSADNGDLYKTVSGTCSRKKFSSVSTSTMTCSPSTSSEISEISARLATNSSTSARQTTSLATSAKLHTSSSCLDGSTASPRTISSSLAIKSLSAVSQANVFCSSKYATGSASVSRHPAANVYKSSETDFESFTAVYSDFVGGSRTTRTDSLDGTSFSERLANGSLELPTVADSPTAFCSNSNKDFPSLAEEDSLSIEIPATVPSSLGSETSNSVAVASSATTVPLSGVEEFDSGVLPIVADHSTVVLLSPLILQKAKTSLMMQPKVILEQCPLSDIIASKLVDKKKKKKKRSSKAEESSSEQSKRRKHTESDKDICSVCFRAFSSSFNLRRHIRGVHKMEVSLSNYSSGKMSNSKNSVPKVSVVRIDIDSTKPPPFLPEMSSTGIFETTVPSELPPADKTGSDSELARCELPLAKQRASDSELNDTVVRSESLETVARLQLPGIVSQSELPETEAQLELFPMKKSASNAELPDTVARLELPQTRRRASSSSELPETAADERRATSVTKNGTNNTIGEEFCYEEEEDDDDEEIPSSVRRRGSTTMNGRSENVGFLQIESDFDLDKSSLEEPQMDFGKLVLSELNDDDAESEEHREEQQRQDELFVNEEVSAAIADVESMPKMATKVESEVFAASPCFTLATAPTRGRTSTRTVKLPPKRGCPCCENDSPNPKRKLRRNSMNQQLSVHCGRQTRGSTRGRNVNA